MAVYQGTRRRSLDLPVRPRVVPDAPAIGRRRVRAAVRARRGPSRVGMLLGAIVITFVCMFFSLAQDVRVSAVGYEVDRLQTQQGRMDDRLRDLRNELNRLGKAPAVRKLAIDAGLSALPEPIILPAR
jgi:hypothetical protein